MRPRLRNVPARLATRAYILHAGLEKWTGTPERAAGRHGTAAGAYPFLGRIRPEMFLKLLAAAEIGTGAALLLPVVPNRLAGAALTAFSGSLLGLYLRTEAMHKPGSVWPTQAGTAVSKDVFTLAVTPGRGGRSRSARASWRGPRRRC